VNFDWLSKNHYVLYLCDNFTTQNRWKRTQIFQQIWLNWDIGCKNFSTSNWTSRLCGDTFGPLGYLGVKIKASQWLASKGCGWLLKGKTWSFISLLVFDGFGNVRCTWMLCYTFARDLLLKEAMLWGVLDLCVNNVFN